MGAAFAKINTGDLRQAETFATAIKDGVREARQKSARELELLNDPEALSDMGFTKIGRSSDDGFDDDFCPDDACWDAVLRGARF